MLRKILKYNLIVITALVIFSGHAKADNDPAFVVHAPNQDLNVPAEVLKKWQTPTVNSGKFISFEPEQNADKYLLAELGLKSSPKNHSDFSKYDLGAIYNYLRTIEPKINRDTENA